MRDRALSLEQVGGYASERIRRFEEDPKEIRVRKPAGALVAGSRLD